MKTIPDLKKSVEGHSDFFDDLKSKVDECVEASKATCRKVNKLEVGVAHNTSRLDELEA